MTDTDESAGIARGRETFAVVGELVMISTALDFQLNRVLMNVLNLGDNPMIEPVVATLDPARKLEMLKARAGHMPKNDWRKNLLKFVEQTEAVFRQRNIACHTPPVLENGVWTFKPVAAAKLLKKIDLEEKTVEPSSIEDLKKAIKIGEAALGQGVSVAENFDRANAELKKAVAPQGGTVSRAPPSCAS
jgi:hypothetical protein